jgi:Zn-dependent M16 (insulinase) family peptidase
MTGGTPSLPFEGAILKQSKTPKGIAAIAAKLSELHRRVIAITPTVLSAGAGDDGKELGSLLVLPASQPVARVVAAAQAEVPLESAALHAVSQINHCVAAWRAPMLHEEGAAALAVAGELMTNQLHTALREKGGAYGGSAGYTGSSGTFVMSSYRDPRLAGTYADFDLAIDQMLETEFSQEELEEAILGVIKGMDKPNAPYDQVLHAWSLHQRGVDDIVRQRFRTDALTCTLEDIRAAVRQWLKNGKPSRAAFAGNLTQDLAGLKGVDLLELANAA